jgi:hypothetical protein
VRAAADLIQRSGGGRRFGIELRTLITYVTWRFCERDG